MAKRYRQDSAQLNLRLKPQERERIYRAIPRGSFNSVALQLIMDYVHLFEASNPDLALTTKDSAA